MTPQESPLQKRTRLVALYSELNEGELLNLRDSYDDLTEVAKQVLDDELTRRELWLKDPPDAEDTDSYAGPLGVARLSIWESKTNLEAEVVRHLLHLAGIDAVAVPLPGVGSSQPLHVTVTPDDAERALVILSQGIPEEIANELAAQFTPGHFVMPSCKNCGSRQVILDSVESANSWSCSACGMSWQENPVEEPIVYQEHLPSGELQGEEKDKLQTREELNWIKRRVLSNRRSILIVIACTVMVVVGGLGQPWTPLRWLGLSLFVSSELLWIVARLQLGSSFATKAEAHALVTSGLYARMQNPIYVFGGITAAGLILYLNQPWYLLIFLVILPLQVVRIRRERRVLADKFGDAYRHYRRQTWF